MKIFRIFVSISLLTLIGTLLNCNPKSNKAMDQAENQSSNKEMSVEGQKSKNVKRIGMIIKIKPDRLNEYLQLHSDTNPGVRDLLTKYNIRNFSIFMTRLEDGNYYEFGYYEYTGNDFDGDMAKLAKEPRNIEWLKTCDPMQIPLNGEAGWMQMKQIYFNK